MAGFPGPGEFIFLSWYSTSHQLTIRSSQVFIHIHNLTEALAVLAHSLHWQNVLAIFPQRVLADERLTLYQPERLIGLALILGGTFIRIDCYRRLQKNFTFQLAVREDHKLITDGPYSYVRHPSYLGALMVSLGALLMNYGRGSFWFEHGFTERSLWVWLGVADVALKYVFYSGAVKRCKLEDDVLKAHFQEQWIKWSKKTPYRMVPFVY